MTAFTAKEKLKEVEREIGMRHRVFRSAIDRGDKTKARQIEIMKAIADDYRPLAAAEADGPLFASGGAS